MPCIFGCQIVDSYLGNDEDNLSFEDDVGLVPIENLPD